MWFHRGLPLNIGAVVGQMGQQPVGRLAGLRGGTDDGAGILAHHLQPRAHVISVAHRRDDPERGATERARNLGDQFLEGVFLRAEIPREVPPQP
jgi:hypothetical protein